ncbi:hypothetical protein PAPYR_2053 [Paratrimastix pyriformis]|uniref:Uncharacterized protein n=1 Tax=Paratrimastix pyriformis TaxID=342808 RepID=A0ABQ8UUQ3_9EUKA|nr:hypothetical protein PAPYR_2053 [Paratrimastix pyriformis]
MERTNYREWVEFSRQGGNKNAPPRNKTGTWLPPGSGSEGGPALHCRLSGRHPEIAVQAGECLEEIEPSYILTSSPERSLTKR